MSCFKIVSLPSWISLDEVDRELEYLFGKAEQLVKATRDMRSIQVSVSSLWNVIDVSSTFFRKSETAPVPWDDIRRPEPLICLSFRLFPCLEKMKMNDFLWVILRISYKILKCSNTQNYISKGRNTDIPWYKVTKELAFENFTYS